MSTILAVETATETYQIGLAKDGDYLFQTHASQFGPAQSSLYQMVNEALQETKFSLKDLNALVVNCGPGGLSHVRSGVAFVNALAYSSGLGIYAFNQFEVLTYQARQTTDLPLILAVPAANDQAYLACSSGGLGVDFMRFGPLDSTLAEISASLGAEVAVAGRIENRLAEILADKQVLQTGIAKPEVKALLACGYQALMGNREPERQIAALNDQSEVFYATPSA